MNEFQININCVVLTTDITANKKYVLSLTQEDITLPNLYITKESVANLESNIIDYLKSYLFVSDLELLPQIITLHSDQIKSDENNNTLNVVYGFIVSHSQSINNAYWVEFSYFNAVSYSNLLFEVIQKLQ